MTAGDMPIGDFTYPVSTDLSGKQFYAVYLASTNNILIATASFPCLGVLQDNPNGGTKATVGSVREIGHSKVWVDASTIVAGSPLKVSSTAGKLGLGVLGTDPIVAVALEANGSATGIIEVALTNRVAQGAFFRAGQLAFDIPIAKLAATGYVYAAVPLGFDAVLVDIYAVATSVCAATTTSTAALEVLLGASGTTSVGSLAIPVTQLTEAHVEAFGTVMTSTGTVTAGAGVITAATTHIGIHVTQGSTTFGGGDTGYITLYVVYN